ncbi:hypothetical protein ACTFIV_008430 [Dictyostelium citrinum]
MFNSSNYNYNNDNDEILFWKVFKNVVIRNLIFKVMSEQVIEYDDIKKYYIGNRVKFSNIKSLNWISKRKIWAILKDKLISNQYIKISKKGLSNFFRYCKDLDTIKLLFQLKKNEINSITDPINESIENENELSLKYFINYIDEKTGEKLSINYNQLYTYDYRGFYLTSMSIFQSVYFVLKERNQHSDIDLLKNQLLYGFLFQEKDYGLISTIYKKFPDLYPKKEDSISDSMNSVPFETVIKLDSTHRDLQINLFLNDFISFKKSFPSSVVANNYNNYSLDDFLFIYKCAYKSNNLLVEPKKVDEIVNKMIKEIKSEEKKIKFLKLELAKELTHLGFNISYLCDYDNDFDSLYSESVASYVFSMFSISGLNYLIETSFRFDGVSIVSPNEKVIINNPALVIEFTNAYFQNGNHFSMKYKGWLYIISSILKNCKFEVLKEIIETVPYFPLKLISKLLYSFDLDCPSKMVKLINLLKTHEDEIDENEDDEYSSQFSLKSFKFSDYLIGLNSNFKINSVSQFNDLKVLNDLFIPCLSSIQENDPNSSMILNFYKSLSVLINSMDILKASVINYPFAPKELFNNYLIKLINNFDLDSIKEVIEIIKFAKIDGNDKAFSFNKQGTTENRYQSIEEILNYLNEINYSKLFNGNGISSFFIGLFNSFSNIDELIEKCPSFKKVSFSLFNNQSSIIIFQILYNQSINFKDRLKIIKYILHDITKLSVFDYFSNDKDRDIIFNQEFSIFDQQTSKIIINDLDANDIIETIEILFKKVDKKEINNSTTNEIIQVLFDLLVQSKNVTFQQIDFIFELCDINSIALSIGYFHTFYFYNLKSIKLSNMILEDPTSSDSSKTAIFSKKNLYGRYFFFFNASHSYTFIKNSSFNFLVKEIMKSYYQPTGHVIEAILYLFTINEPELAISILKESIKNSEEILYHSTNIIKSIFKSGFFKISFQKIINDLVELDSEIFSIDKLLKRSILLERIDITNFIISNFANNIN